jgi:hypothetical protein
LAWLALPFDCHDFANIGIGIFHVYI